MDNDGLRIIAVNNIGKSYQRFCHAGSHCFGSLRFNEQQSPISPGQHKVDFEALLITKVIKLFGATQTDLSFHNFGGNKCFKHRTSGNPPFSRETFPLSERESGSN